MHNCRDTGMNYMYSDQFPIYIRPSLLSEDVNLLTTDGQLIYKSVNDLFNRVVHPAAGLGPFMPLKQILGSGNMQNRGSEELRHPVFTYLKLIDFKNFFSLDRYSFSLIN